jgi:tRNA(Ile)-lysidine synthase
MAPRSRRLGLTLLRPLLDIPRARLEARLKAEGIAWLDDPMNEDSRFSRVQIRRAQGLLAKVGLTPARLAQTARHMARVRRALEAAVDTLGAEAAPLAPEGYARLDPARLLAAPDEIGHRLFARLLMRIGGRGLPPRFDSLQRLYGLVRTGGLVRGKTLGGCRILPRSDGALLILREASPAPLILVPGRTLLWDGRFRVQLPANAFLDAPPLLRALGADGIHALRKASPGTRLNDLPGPVRASLPSLWIHQEPAAIPHLNYVAAGAPPPIHGFTARFDGF